MNRGTLVTKFGGTSVGSGAAFVRAARIAAGEARNRPLAVVVSAMSGVTDALLGYAEATAETSGTATRTSTGATREGSAAELYRSLADRHLRAVGEAVSEEHRPAVEARIRELLGRLAEVVSAPEGDPESRRAAVAVFGERLSAGILAGAINSIGVPAAVVAEDPIATDSRFAEAEVLAEETQRRCTRLVRPLLDAGAVAVVPGYVGVSPEGLPTTLGRGGSDLSATAIGRALGAAEVHLFSDVDGVLDADPRLVPDARLLPELSYREAAVFAGLGAKVLHHRTMEPAAAAGMEVRARNTFDPAGPGTRISAREGGPGIRCVALRRDLSIEHRSEPAGKDVFCLLDAGDGPGFRVLADDPWGERAAVVCVGRPEDGELVRGLQALERAGIQTLWAGNTARGLLFVVDARSAEDALRSLHGELAGAEVPVQTEVAV